MLYTALPAMRRADQMYHEQIGDKQSLAYGIAFWSSEFPDSAQDNAFREVFAETPQALERAWKEVRDFYQAKGLVCRRWAPSAEQQFQPMDAFLVPRGWAKESHVVMQLADWPETKFFTGIEIFPARAMRKAFRALHEKNEDVILAERRLDYAQYDVYVALLNDQPAGRAGLLQVGEIANVRSVYVDPAFRRRGVGTALVQYLLVLARRLMMKIVCLKIHSQDHSARTFFEQCNFVEQGVLTEYCLNSEHQ